MLPGRYALHCTSPRVGGAGKLAAAIAHGAEVIQVQGSFDDALSLVVEISQQHQVALVNSLNPYRLEGQKTAAFEICDRLGSAPDWLCLPVGNAGNISSYWIGFQQYDSLRSSGLPRLGRASRRRSPTRAGAAVDHPETVATAIRIAGRRGGRPAGCRGSEAASCGQR
jgi:threonine synthase